MVSPARNVQHPADTRPSGPAGRDGSRGDWTPLELFYQGIVEWQIDVVKRLTMLLDRLAEKPGDGHESRG